MGGTAAKRFDTLDLLRGIAALAVVTLHYAAISGSPPILPHAYLAVDLFFGLSGFVIAHAYGQQLLDGEPVRRFMLRRLIRLYPLFLLALVVGSLLIINEKLPDGTPARSFDQWLVALGANLVFFPAPAAAAGVTGGLFPGLWPAWSLFWELFANLLFAVLAPRLSWRMLGALLAIGLVMLVETGARWGNLNAGVDWATFLGGPGRLLWSYFSGVALQRLYARMRVAKLPSSSAAVPAAILLAALAMPQIGWGYDVAAAALLPLLVIWGAQVERPSRIGHWLGYISYALYVVHVPVLNITDKLSARLIGRPLNELPQLLLLLPCLGLTVCVAALVTRYYDDPVRAWLGRAAFSRPRKLTTTSPVAL